MDNNNQTQAQNAPQTQAPPAQTNSLPFIPAKQAEDSVKSSHIKIIIILLICILAVNAAMLVKQFIPTTARGFDRDFTIGGSVPSDIQQTPGGVPSSGGTNSSGS
jgi:hypothetical protein